MREKLDVAQDAFALAAGVDRSYYGKLERGERQPSLSILLRIATALGCPGYLLVENVEKHLRLAKSKARRPSEP
jgi:XRE family transcriptional regulator, regulator of sulfur utilization